MAWWVVAVFIVSLFIAVSMIPKPQVQPPPGINDVKVMTAEEGREIPVLFGSKDVRGLNCVGYWNVRIVPIKSKTGKK